MQPNPNPTVVDDSTRELILGYWRDCYGMTPGALHAVISEDRGDITVDEVRTALDQHLGRA